MHGSVSGRIVAWRRIVVRVCGGWGAAQVAATRLNAAGLRPPEVGSMHGRAAAWPADRRPHEPGLDNPQEGRLHGRHAASSFGLRSRILTRAGGLGALLALALGARGRLAAGFGRSGGRCGGTSHQLELGPLCQGRGGGAVCAVGGARAGAELLQLRLAEVLHGAVAPLGAVAAHKRLADRRAWVNLDVQVGALGMAALALQKVGADGHQLCPCLVLACAVGVGALAQQPARAHRHLVRVMRHRAQPGVLLLAAARPAKHGAWAPLRHVEPLEDASPHRQQARLLP
mmetsp:Transcript_3547/g.8831  ORF Transcript_3547/g.8831 Transcript_3547/m.8831 type:complete len:286 (-) Transcript_3547:1022-1879(-)